MDSDDQGSPLPSEFQVLIGGYMTGKEKTIDKVYQSLFTSLAWVAVVITCAIFFMLSADVINVDFLHINLHRMQINAALIPFIFAPLLFCIV